MGYFYYPSLQTELRGAVATANIARGEEVCFVPVQQMLSEFSVGNSSLLGLMRNYIARSPKGKVSTASSVTMKAVIAVFVIREGARESSRWMPYLKGALDQHSPDPIPTNWKKGDPRLQKLSAYGQKLAMQSRARALRQYATIFPDAFTKYSDALSEGIACHGSKPGAPAKCSQPELEQLYSQDAFVGVYSVLRARDWVLEMHGTERPFLAPVIDLLNFGQVGIRASYDDRRGGFAARTVQPIKKGQELLFYYGNFCIDDAINMYGFAPSSAPQCKAAGAGKKLRKAKPKNSYAKAKPYAKASG